MEDRTTEKLSAGTQLRAWLARGAYWIWLGLAAVGTLAIVVYALFFKTILI